jgi:hypothetical protein
VGAHLLYKLAAWTLASRRIRPLLTAPRT